MTAAETDEAKKNILDIFDGKFSYYRTTTTISNGFSISFDQNRNLVRIYFLLHGKNHELDIGKYYAKFRFSEDFSKIIITYLERFDH
jgi:hypothetical protein